MTETEVLDTITLVCNRVKNKYKVTISDSDDVFQEAFLECVRAMERYNGKHPLENFLMVNLHNRMHNFRRNMLNRELKTINLEIGEEPSYEVQPDKLKYFRGVIDAELSVDMRHDYLRMRDGVRIPRIRQRKLYEELRKLAEEFGVSDD